MPGNRRYVSAVPVSHEDAVAPKPLVGLFAGSKRAYRERKVAEASRKWNSMR